MEEKIEKYKSELPLESFSHRPFFCSPLAGISDRHFHRLGHISAHLYSSLCSLCTAINRCTKLSTSNRISFSAMAAFFQVPFAPKFPKVIRLAKVLGQKFGTMFILFVKFIESLLKDRKSIRISKYKHKLRYLPSWCLDAPPFWLFILKTN